MTIFDNEIREAIEKKNAIKNLKYSLLALGLLILSALTAFIAADMFYPGHNILIHWILIFLIIFLAGLAAIIAVLALKKSFTTIKTSHDSKNYFAIGISILVLLAIVSQIIEIR
jgi:hypothetical protein